MVECLLPGFLEALSLALLDAEHWHRLDTLLDAHDDSVERHTVAGAVRYINAAFKAVALPVRVCDKALAYLRAYGYCIQPMGAGEVVSARQFTA